MIELVLSFLKWIRRLMIRIHLRCWRFGDSEWNFAVCAVFKDEARYLGEWLDFHRLSGVDHFFLYDDESSDEFIEILQPWIDRNRVTLRKAKGRRQKAVYNHCLRHGARRSRWIAFIDLDEFLFSPLGKPLGEVMERFSAYPAVFVHWLLFGSNGHVRQPAGGVLDNYTKTIGLSESISDNFDHQAGGDKNLAVTARARQGKSIINPRLVVEAGIHRPSCLFHGRLIDENASSPQEWPPPGTPFTCETLRINHYWSKSIEELTSKILRGYIHAEPGTPERLARNIEREGDLNKVEDRLILRVRDMLSNSGAGAD